jgi:hypothetical protein
MSDRDPGVVLATIESAISEGESHLRHMRRAAGILSRYFPLTPTTLHDLPEDHVAVLDQFIYRFTKLQDSMASRLLPSLHAFLRADDTPRPFLDVLSYLEKLGALTSEESWQFFRGLRNGLAHDYPESAEQTTQTLNELFERRNEIWAMFTAARDYYRAHSTEAEAPPDR